MVHDSTNINKDWGVTEVWLPWQVTKFLDRPCETALLMDIWKLALHNRC